MCMGDGGHPVLHRTLGVQGRRVGGQEGGWGLGVHSVLHKTLGVQGSREGGQEGAWGLGVQPVQGGGLWGGRERPVPLGRMQRERLG